VGGFGTVGLRIDIVDSELKVDMGSDVVGSDDGWTTDLVKIGSAVKILITCGAQSAQRARVALVLLTCAVT